MTSSDSLPYDALLLVSFGGPEGPDDVLPFLDNVLRGRDVPTARRLAVAEHYQRFGGVSPINQHCRDLLSLLSPALAERGIDLPWYWGNRNWHPLLTDTVETMARAGVRRALALFTSPYSSYSSCRQYLENLAAARAAVGPAAPQIDKLRAFYNHPGFVSATACRTREALERLPSDARDSARLVFTAHSIPMAMANECRYEHQLRESCRLVSHELGRADWTLVYQSRSGPPSQPWLEPDVLDYLRQARDTERLKSVVLVPIGFLSDHIEVLYDLDVEARALCDELGIVMQRAATVGTHPRIVEMVCELIAERLDPRVPRRALGDDGPSHDTCPADCCARGARSAISD